MPKKEARTLNVVREHMLRHMLNAFDHYKIKPKDKYDPVFLAIERGLKDCAVYALENASMLADTDTKVLIRKALLDERFLTEVVDLLAEHMKGTGKSPGPVTMSTEPWDK